MRSYFLTGCTGFIGKSIIHKLMQSTDTKAIVALTRQPWRRANEFPQWAKDDRLLMWGGDVADCELPRKSQFGFTDMIHGANDAQGKLDENPYRLYYSMVEGTRRMLDWAQGNNVYRVAFLSSGGVARDDIYGRGKQVSEFFNAHYKVWPRNLRIYSTLGPGMPLNGQYAAGIFVWQALDEGRVKVVGGANAFRTYLDVEDTADWIIAALDRGSSLGTYDITSARKISILDLARLVAQVFEVPLEAEEGEYRPDLYPAQDEYFPNPQYTMDRLRVQQTITLEQSLERIKDHFRGR